VGIIRFSERKGETGGGRNMRSFRTRGREEEGLDRGGCHAFALDEVEKGTR